MGMTRIFRIFIYVGEKFSKFILKELRFPGFNSVLFLLSFFTSLSFFSFGFTISGFRKFLCSSYDIVCNNFLVKIVFSWRPVSLLNVEFYFQLSILSLISVHLLLWNDRVNP